MEDHDSPWKAALEEFFEPFLRLLFPAIHASVDWAHPIRFLDKELQKLRPTSHTGRRHVDKLVEVGFRDGKLCVLLIHVEVQGRQDRRFAERMFLYYTRLRDHYGKSVLSLAVLADGSRRFRPTHFEDRIKGKGVRFDFHVVKLLDYKARCQELLQSDNPFALLVAAQLTAKLEARASKRRVDNLVSFYRRIRRLGLSEQKAERLLLFLDWLVALPPKLEDYYNAETLRLQEESIMRPMTHIERFSEQRGLKKGRKEGRQEGLHQGRAAILLRQLQLKFGDLPIAISQRITQASEAELDLWAERILFVTSLEDVFAG